MGARYAYPLSGGAEIVTSADYGWTDDQRSQVSNLDNTVFPSYGVLNARVQYKQRTIAGAWLFTRRTSPTNTTASVAPISPTAIPPEQRCGIRRGPASTALR